MFKTTTQRRWPVIIVVVDTDCVRVGFQGKKEEEVMYGKQRKERGR